MGNYSFSISLLLLSAIFNSCLCHGVTSDDNHHPFIETNRDTLEIIIGGGKGGSAPAPSPDNGNCPPPPPKPECPPPPSPPKPPRSPPHSPPPKPPRSPPHSPPPKPPRSPPPKPPRSPPHSPPPKPPRSPPHSPPPKPPRSPPHSPTPKPPHSPTPKPQPRPPTPRNAPPSICGSRIKNDCFETELIAAAFNVIQDFKKIVEPNQFTKTWKGKDVCKYKGFKCAIRPDKKKRAVAVVDFNGYKLTGKNGRSLPLKNFIDRLEDLAVFHANSNNFTGTISDIGISKINYLYELDLSNNKLDGNFPMEVLKAKNLTFLDLRFNKFDGKVPQQVFNLDLDVLFINNNNLKQKLPDNLGDTPALYLTFANNLFTGQIPKSIGRAPNLLEVLFLNNQLTGCLPYEIGNLSKATVFDVGSNKLWGPIPNSFGCLKKIELLNLADNMFYGDVPEMVCQLSKLDNLSLSNNYFTQVGPSCRDLIMKKKLDVRNNCILDLPSQRSKADCTKFFSNELVCNRKESFKLIPCMNGKHGFDLGLTHKSGKESTVSSSSARSYGVLKPHRRKVLDGFHYAN